MRYRPIIGFFVLLFLTHTASGFADSLGVEKKGDKVFVLHKVDPKETLYSLSKRYNAPVALISEHNPDLAAGLKIGQVLRIPVTVAAPAKTAAVQPGKKHTVAPSQTLYAISRLYKVTVEDIKKWNSLLSNELSVGQEIYVSEPVTATPPEFSKEVLDSLAKTPNFRLDAKGNKIHKVLPGQTLYSISRIYKKSVEDIVRWNNLASEELSLDQELLVEKVQDHVTPVTQTYTINPNAVDTTRIPDKNYTPPSGSVFNKVTERGLAEAIEETSENPKFLALHRTAPVGTIIQVTNEMNQQYIFVRVIGKLPATGANDKLVIKLSKKAYNKLGAVDKRFPVELSYVP